MTYLQKEALKEALGFALFLVMCFAVLLVFDDADVVKLIH